MHASLPCDPSDQPRMLRFCVVHLSAEELEEKWRALAARERVQLLDSLVCLVQDNQSVLFL